MPTVEDLRTLLHDVADAQAGDPAVLLAALTAPSSTTLTSDGPRRHRMRLVAPLVAALAVVGLVVGLLAVTRGGRAGGPTAAAGSALLPVTGYVFTIGALPAGWSWSYADAGADTQSAIVEAADHATVATVSVYAAAAAPSSRPPGATSIIVNGRAGWRVGLAADKPTPSGLIGQVLPESVVWSDRSGVWVEVAPWAGGETPGKASPPAPTQAQVAAVAGAVSVSAALTEVSPAKIIAKFGYLPAGRRLESVSEIHDARPASKFELASSVDGQAGLGISVTPSPAAIPASGPGDVPLTVGQFSGIVSGATVYLGDGRVSVTITTAGPSKAGGSVEPLATDEVAKILAAMILAATPSDRSTWFDAAVAIPN